MWRDDSGRYVHVSKVHLPLLSRGESTCSALPKLNQEPPSRGLSLRALRGFVVVAGVVVLANLARAQWYTAVEVSGFSPAAINNSGEMVGSNFSAGHAASYIGGTFTDLGSLPGLVNSMGLALNNTGTIVGSSSADPYSPSHGFSYKGGVMTDLGFLPGLNVTQANGINDAGTIVGECANQTSQGTNNLRAFSLTGGQMTNLGIALGAVSSSANAINASGTVVGWGQVTSSQGFVTHAISFANGLATDLGGLEGYPSSQALAVNDAGTAAGWAYFGSDGSTRGFMAKDGIMRDLGTLPGYVSSYATAINSIGDIVGYSDAITNGNVGEKAFIYRDRVMYDLNALVSVPGGALARATAINDSGQIAVYTNAANAYLLTPIPGAGPFPPATTPVARLVNISTRAQVGTGANVMIPGFVIGGSGTETLLIRADGPALTGFGIQGVLASPSLSLTAQSGAVLATNTGWGTNTDSAQIASAAASLGAFPLANGSDDCAVLMTLQPGAYTVQISGVANTTGVALAEVYEVSYTGTARLLNISTRAQVGVGGDIIIPGFVIAGSGEEEVLLRGDGPGLAGFGVPGALAQPTLTVIDQSTGNTIATDSAWGTNSIPSAIVSAGSAVQAFALAPGSADSALVLSLKPGAYTMHLSGVNDTTGVALAEVYEVP